MPMTPAPEEVFTIAPPPCLRMSGISCFMHRKTPRRLMSMIRFPLFLIVVRSRSRLPWLDARVIEGEVQTAEGFNGLGQRRLDVLSPRHVAAGGDCPPTRLPDQAGRLLVVMVGHIRGHHAGSLASERQRRRASDAARAPGHERDLSGETSISIRCHFLFLSVVFN